MDHAYFRDRVSAYHDRELPPQELAIVEEHIRGCAECQALLAELERLDALVAQHAELAGGDYWETSARKIEERLGFAQPTEIVPVKKAGWERGLVWKISAIAATLAVLVFIGVNKDKIMPPEKVIPTATPPSEIPPAGNVPAPSPDSAAPATNASENKAPQQAPETLQPRGAQEGKKPAGVSKDEVARERETLQPSGAADNYGEAARTTPPPAPRPEEQAQPMVGQTQVQKTPLQDTEAQTTSQEQTISKRKGVQSVETQADQTARRAPVAPTISQAAPPVDSVSISSADLDRWRNTRDSLQNLLKADDVSLLNRYSINSLVQKADNASRGSLKSAFIPPQRDKSPIERAYLQASYEIALRTPDADEYQSAEGALQKVAAERKSANAATAQQLLDRLRAQRPTPPEK